MTTTSPIRKVHNVPIVKAVPPQRALPMPDPKRLVPIPLIPIKKREVVGI